MVVVVVFVLLGAVISQLGWHRYGYMDRRLGGWMLVGRRHQGRRTEHLLGLLLSLHLHLLLL